MNETEFVMFEYFVVYFSVYRLFDHAHCPIYYVESFSMCHDGLVRFYLPNKMYLLL